MHFLGVDLLMFVVLLIWPFASEFYDAFAQTCRFVVKEWQCWRDGALFGDCTDFGYSRWGGLLWMILKDCIASI